MEYVIAYDLGTGGSKASLFDAWGNSLADCFISYDTFYPESGFREQRPSDWWGAIVESTKTLLGTKKIDVKSIKSLAVSGHSLGAVPLDAKGNLLAEYVPIWSDTRAKAQAERFFAKIDEDSWYSATGNGFPSLLYAVFKQMWYKDNMPKLYGRTYKFIGTKDYINFMLTGKICTDISYASGSGIYDLKQKVYKDEYIKVAGVSKDKQPEILPSTAVIGTLTAQAAQKMGLHTDVKVVCGGVDNACMAIGAGCVKDGMAYTSLGTSAWIAVSGHEPITDTARKPFVFAHCVPGMFVSATSIFSAGNSLRWLRDNVCDGIANKKNAYDIMTGLAAASPLGAKGLLFNPSLAGGSSQEKSINIKGGFVGLTLEHKKPDLIRAVLEGICMNLRLALDVLESYTDVSGDMLIVGGGAKSSFWRRLFADIYDKNIVQSTVCEDAGSLGAFALAAVGTGIWKSFDEILNVHKITGKTKPDKINVKKYEKVLALFRKVADIFADIGDEIESLKAEGVIY